MDWWFRRHSWSKYSNGRLLVFVVAFFAILLMVFFASEREFRLIVSIVIAAIVTPHIVDAFRQEPTR
jgi:hypothetical protein